jgi:hypothetical protein
MDRTPHTPRFDRAIDAPPHPMSMSEFELLIADYVAGQLDDPELSRFEVTLLANPQWAEWVEAEQMLRAGMRELAQQEPRLFATSPARVSELQPPAPRARANHWWAGGLALAATLSGAALLWSAQRENQQLRDALAIAEAPSGDVAFIRLDAQRSIDNVSTAPISAPDANTSVLIELPAGPQPLEAYRVRLLRDGEVTVDIPRAGVSADGMITVALRGKRLTPGRYRLVVTDADGGTMPIGSYELNLVR